MIKNYNFSLLMICFLINKRYEKEISLREKISKPYANFIKGIPYYAFEVIF